MKANKKDRDEFISNRNAFGFIVPLTMVIVIGFSLLVIGAYVVGTIGSVLEDTYADNTLSGSISQTYTYTDATGFITPGYRNYSLPSGSNVDDLNVNTTKFYVYAFENDINFGLTVNGQNYYITNNVTKYTGQNVTLEALIANSTVNVTDTYIWMRWNVTTPHANITIAFNGEYYVSTDYRADNENKTVHLIGNITDGFSDVVDIEIVVIIITVLSMAILSIMAVGTRRNMF